MEKIDGKAGALNPRSMLKTNEEFQKYHQYGIISKRINYHKKIENENMVVFFLICEKSILKS